MYADKIVELRSLNPDIVELTRQVEEKQKTDITRDRVVGNEYERQKYKKGVIDSKNGALDEYTNKQEERIEDKVDMQNNQMSQNLINSIEEQQKMADSCFAKFESTGDIRDYNEAVSHLKMAEQMAGITSVEFEEIEEMPQDVNEEVDKEDKNVDERKEDIENDKKDNMGLDRTADDRISNLKASYRERSNELNEKLNGMRNKDKEKDDNVMVRKMN